MALPNSLKEIEGEPFQNNTGNTGLFADKLNVVRLTTDNPEYLKFNDASPQNHWVVMNPHTIVAQFDDGNNPQAVFTVRTALNPGGGDSDDNSGADNSCKSGDKTDTDGSSSGSSSGGGSGGSSATGGSSSSSKTVLRWPYRPGSSDFFVPQLTVEQLPANQ